MSTKLYRNKSRRRRRKTEAGRRHRTAVQKRRLLALGVTEEKLKHMNEVQVREALRCPKKLAAKAG